ncbi:MAG: biopolymer transporter ExbD [Sphingorhabdus sp.]
MAMSGGSDDGSPMMEMNTTPLIDVMLVLLIMLMITIPPVTHMVDIDLPVATPPEEDEIKVDPVVNKIFIDDGGAILWNGAAVSQQQVADYLQQTKAMTPEPELQFQPTENAPYVTVDEVLAVVKRSKITKFGFVGNENYRVFGKSAVSGSGK